MTLFNRFLKDESGATAIEYALIAALIGVALIAALGTLSGKIEDLFDEIGTKLDDAIPAAGGGAGT